MINTWGWARLRAGYVGKAPERARLDLVGDRSACRRHGPVSLEEVLVGVRRMELHQGSRPCLRCEVVGELLSQEGLSSPRGTVEHNLELLREQVDDLLQPVGRE